VVSARTFRAWVDELRSVAPVPKGTRVDVRRRTLDGCLGQTQKVGNRIVVTIHKDMTEDETVDTLIHEWAHVLSWRPSTVWNTDHDEHWGLEYAKVYRAFHGTR
jgi:hypothetical protein